MYTFICLCVTNILFLIFMILSRDIVRNINLGKLVASLVKHLFFWLVIGGMFNILYHLTDITNTKVYFIFFSVTITNFITNMILLSICVIILLDCYHRIENLRHSIKGFIYAWGIWIVLVFMVIEIKYCISRFNI